MKNRPFLMFIGLIALTLFLFDALPMTAGAAQIKLRYANFPPAPTFPCVQMERWAKEVQKRTNGKVVVETYPGGTLLNSSNMFDGVLSGMADIGCSCPAYEPGRFPLIAGIIQPVGFKTCKVSSRALWTLTQEFKPKSLKDFKVVTMFTSAPSYLATKKPVRSLEDLAGLELRAAGNMVETLKAMGAAPVGMPMSALPEALQKGVVKGYAASKEVLLDFKFAEIVKYVTDYSLGTVSFAVLMNKAKWNSLPEDVQKVIDDLGEEQAIWVGEYMDKHVAEAVVWAKKEQGLEVITISEREKLRWDNRLEPVVKAYLEDTKSRGLPGKAFLDRLYELKAQYEKE